MLRDDARPDLRGEGEVEVKVDWNAITLTMRAGEERSEANSRHSDRSAARTMTNDQEIKKNIQTSSECISGILRIVEELMQEDLD